MSEFPPRDVSGLSHGYGFDPTHGYTLESLLSLVAPEEPPGFVEFWQDRYAAIRDHSPTAVLRDTGRDTERWRTYEWSFLSTQNTEIRGWVLLPTRGPIRRGFLVGHGYGGRGAPDWDLEFDESALFFPCARGLGRSWNPYISSDPRWHILHDIQSRKRYILGRCVEDVWIAITAILRLLPELSGHLGFLGISFGAGIGALAIPWDPRIQRAHLHVPTFGNLPLRLKLPSNGSALHVQKFVAGCPKALDVLRYYDAAVAARHIRIPTQCACALFDPTVAPAGQFSIYNSLAGSKDLFVRTAGHHDYPGQLEEDLELRRNCYNFFADM